METLAQDGTERTPKIVLDQKNGIFEISGRSLSDRPREVYEPIIQWLEKYSLHPNPTTPFVFKLDYINTGSSKLILDLFYSLQKIDGARVLWYFQEEDEDMEETGEEFAELVTLPFELKAVE